LRCIYFKGGKEKRRRRKATFDAVFVHDDNHVLQGKEGEGGKEKKKGERKKTMRDYRLSIVQPTERRKGKGEKKREKLVPACLEDSARKQFWGEGKEGEKEKKKKDRPLAENSLREEKKERGGSKVRRERTTAFCTTLY